ncbi:hypothetical protein J2Z83_001794 [Virgibacillus natechei]|uniref:Uncharacterized protein n=1 Tax=Virgibacillus natechei TaxID=1216297 RepID=A0ABS4IFH5_9BACI|nr:hypothetical protein [Virgibacillus natechei]
MKTPAGGKASVRPHSALIDEGQLKPPFAGNVGIPLAGARRLTSRPRKAKCVSVANRSTHPSLERETFQKNCHYVVFYINCEDLNAIILTKRALLKE